MVKRSPAQNVSYDENVIVLKRYNVRKDDEETPTVAVAVIEENEESLASAPEIPLPRLQAEETVNDIEFSTHLTPIQKKEALEIASRFKRVLTDIPLNTSLATYDMNVEVAKPVFVRQYPLPHAKVEVVKKEVQEMKRLGVIEPAASPYNSPIVLVGKPDGRVRFCTDYRKLNDVTVFDGENLPDVEQLFSKLGKAQYFTKMDLSKGYWQIPIKEEVRHMTAFTTPLGQFQWTMMPFGLKNAVAVFSRMMRKLLEPLQRDDVHNFMDDILIATETWKEHMEAFKAVLKRLDEANLSARPKKCFVGFEELSFLGHVVRHGEILPEMNKIQKIQDAPVPRNKKEVRSFMGLCGYYRKFVPNFATIAHPLTDLTKKDAPNEVVWNLDCERAFDTLKTRLVSQPVLQLPDLTQSFVLRTDASDQGVGAVLLQEKDKLHPVAYASRKLSSAEGKYSTVEKECLAVVWAVDKFQQYLYGQEFILETDHQPLKYLKTAKNTNNRLMRWSLHLQSYSFSVRVIPGKDNVGADFLSRCCADDVV